MNDDSFVNIFKITLKVVVSFMLILILFGAIGMLFVGCVMLVAA